MQKVFDGAGTPPYMPLHRRGDAAFQPLHCIGRQHSRTPSPPIEIAGKAKCPLLVLNGSLTLSVMMKGHVGGGPGSCSFKVQGAQDKKPSLTYMSYTFP